jgi:hypothetical protein
LPNVSASDFSATTPPLKGTRKGYTSDGEDDDAFDITDAPGSSTDIGSFHIANLPTELGLVDAATIPGHQEPAPGSNPTTKRIAVESNRTKHLSPMLKSAGRQLNSPQTHLDTRGRRPVSPRPGLATCPPVPSRGLGLSTPVVKEAPLDLSALLREKFDGGSGSDSP